MDRNYTHALLNGVISNDLEWLSKIFNDTKRRAVSAPAMGVAKGGPGTPPNPIPQKNY